MKKQTKPITELRDTNKISKLCHENDEPIFITKNGYDDLVIMSNDSFHKLTSENNKVLFPNQSNNFSMVKVGCATNEIKVASPSINATRIIEIIRNCEKLDLDILVFPELSVTGYFCGDLFFQDSLLNAAYEAIDKIKDATKDNHVLVFIGAPIIFANKLYNCAIAICNGKILGVVPKSNLPNYNEFYEARHFTEFNGDNSTVIINNEEYPFGTKLIFSNRYQTKMKVACELCEDLWSANTPSTSHSLAGANIIVNLSASNELFNKDETRKTLVLATSYRLNCAYLYSSIGNGESTQDLVYSGHNLIAENGRLLKESALFSNELIVTDIDLDLLEATRRKNSSFKCHVDSNYKTIYFEKELKVRPLTREVNPFPFLPNNENETIKYAKEIITLQVMGLAQRLKHINCKNVVLGLSGGLDSTLALIVCHETFKYLNYDSKGIHILIMPCFGTSSRTHNNAIKLAKMLNTTINVISIEKSVTQHLQDLNHPLDVNDVTFENAQARERTQLLFDYSNQHNGIVIGTGDLSELALGWCTYNGDHMSNYAVNTSVPKTLVKFLVKAYANTNTNLTEVLYDILDTPISPELLPPKKGQISQVTEDIIGPYELHDFFIYYLLKYNYSIEKIYYYATYAFKDMYDQETIKKWLNVFIKRFFNSQFKRSCIPDGPKVTDISLSPRGDLRMPSDASFKDFQL